jgi:HAD superfamily hydrolase (TIGR01509 family)
MKRHKRLAVVFDMDGVLIHSTGSHRAAFERIFLPFGIHNFEYSDYAGQRTPEVVEAVLRGASIEFTPALIADLSTAKSRFAREELAASNPVAPDCVPVLEQLSSQYALALASSGSRRSVELFLKTNHCAHLFRSVLCGEDVRDAKPSPEIYTRSFAELGVAPGDAAVVEDAVSGILSAKAAGASTVIGVAGTYSEAQLSTAGADSIVKHLSEIPEALLVTI